ncbi:nucleoside phosphorylase domain-containing protein [Dactylonectria macrodidyma]|uniref:Nucleoside phosphorylase domain-containing protein n=1 Tax=Dactylonectria macrodidyma TaxID=307937 RepID=A0A9P9FTY5_9HYPO|nr:nucleoside phosphorylase domain-containing protein [Dactylonectria macrodidyma]
MAQVVADVTRVINAPIGQIWGIVTSFGAESFWFPVVVTSSLQGYGLDSWHAYAVGILCALPIELLAVWALFDSKYTTPKNLRGDSNNYALGTMNGHMVVAACLPSGEYGTNAAADSASNMKRRFPGIRFCLLVGIGGGAPTEENDIRLGDVVVSLLITRFPGVIQYDRGKEIEGGTFGRTGSLQPPPRYLMTAISSLRSNPDLPSDALQPYLENIAARVPDSFKTQYRHPGQEHNDLFKLACSTCRAHGECANRDSQMQRRLYRPTNHPEVHYGLIASGNRVLKDAKVREQWAREYGILCFEMEAAGVMNIFPCLVIRGICDYADSYKNKLWQ